ncbi:SHO1 osmosensor [Metschnikowia aff. pulcherrima]|uniref:High osmolarity signaling protein SHO1 n=1 Tax=Metschnikowia aff. pulcherrima TaxID=2163413 RepID=A0A4P6XV02_9ASCO|nr:SHO1 osmosensor [Metschnikowia aff. pulcherrima]
MGLRFSNFLGDPFAISTVSFGFIAWIIAIAGAGASDNATYLRFTWWGLVYEILLIIVIFVLYLNNTIELYKFTLVGLLSVAIVYTTNLTNTLVYNLGSSGNLCCAAGCILLSMLNILWVVYFGGHPESPTNQFIDSFSVKNTSYSHGQLPLAANKVDDEFAMPRSNSQAFPVNESRHSGLTNNKYVSSQHLNGLENFSSSNLNQSARNTVYNGGNGTTDNFAVPVTTFRYKAKALYSYDANPADTNEISFAKDEILDVDDIDGKWWQAKKANGQVGICPSNYVKLLD